MSVTAILLAAGASRRFGAGNKLLALVEGEPMIRRVARTLANSSVDAIVVVTGPNGEAIEKALEGLPLRYIANTEHTAGMGRSIAVGIGAIGSAASGALIVPGDMPHLPTHLVDALVSSFESSGYDSIVHPILPDGSQRNPVLWPRRRFADLARLDGHDGAKTLIGADIRSRQMILVSSERVFVDVDVPSDLAGLIGSARLDN